MKDYHYTRYS